eukprot:365383-Chlamydomonas_euryale.AAC.16
MARTCDSRHRSARGPSPCAAPRPPHQHSSSVQERRGKIGSKGGVEGGPGGGLTLQPVRGVHIGTALLLADCGGGGGGTPVEHATHPASRAPARPRADDLRAVRVGVRESPGGCQVRRRRSEQGIPTQKAATRRDEGLQRGGVLHRRRQPSASFDVLDLTQARQGRLAGRGDGSMRRRAA